MPFSREIEAFIKDFVKDLDESNVAIFAGAGMSKSGGYVDWPELLRDIADELGLNVEREHDLISVAQFHVNTRKGPAGLAKKILQEFAEQAEPSDTHKILARLPIGTYWTTNYDTLIEDALRDAYKVADVKHSVKQLITTRPKRDAVVYKMHGDVSVAQDAVLYKEQYERYYQTHASFVTALSGDLVSKTFLFIGFSFTDPNLDYVLSRLHVAAGMRTHYCFMRREQAVEGDDEDMTKYKRRKQELRVDDLKRFGIQTLLIDDYKEVPLVLREVEARYRKKTVFVSGSAEEFGSWSRTEGQTFVHLLAAGAVKANFRVVSGFGWGIGSAVINGALEAIYGQPQKYSEDQLIVRPFPQFGSSPQDLQVLWEEYRQRMISLAGIAIFVFGNKLVDGKVVEASGVKREFEIAFDQGLVLIPLGLTGYTAQVLWDTVVADPARYYKGIEWIVPLVKELNDPSIPHTELVKKLIRILQRLNR